MTKKRRSGRNPKLFVDTTYLPSKRSGRKQSRCIDEPSEEIKPCRTKSMDCDSQKEAVPVGLPPLIPKFLKLGKRIRISDNHSPEGRLGCFIYGNDEYIAYVDETLTLRLQAVGSGMVISLQP